MKQEGTLAHEYRALETAERNCKIVLSKIDKGNNVNCSPMEGLVSILTDAIEIEEPYRYLIRNIIVGKLYGKTTEDAYNILADIYNNILHEIKEEKERIRTLFATTITNNLINSRIDELIRETLND